MSNNSTETIAQAVEKHVTIVKYSAESNDVKKWSILAETPELLRKVYQNM